MNIEQELFVTVVISFIAILLSVASFLASPLFRRLRLASGDASGEVKAYTNDEGAQKQLEAEREKWELKEQGYQQVIRESNVDIQALIDQIKAAGLEPVRKLNGRQARAANGELSVVELFNRMEECFDHDDLDDILLQLGILPGAIQGDTLPGKFRNLIRYCQRRGRLVDLVRVCRSERPRITWPQID